MSKEIYKAVANLPEELITAEIANAAIEEANIELLDHLPHKYLTGAVVVSIIEKNADSYSWRAFSLSNIPEQIRTAEVCEFAVKKDNGNIVAVPFELRSTKMLERMMSSVKSCVKFLHLFPATVWNREIALSGVKSIYSETHYNTGPRGGYRSTTYSTDIKKVQIFLSFVPSAVKDKEFYLSLFDTKLAVEEIELITPKQFKKGKYILGVAKKDFKFVPASQYNYEVFEAAMAEGSAVNITTLFENETIKERLLKCIDSKMADRVIHLSPSLFVALPKKFQTSERLEQAIMNTRYGYNRFLKENELSHLFTEDVCKAMVLRCTELPVLPKSIWTVEFINYCLNNASCSEWFSQLPKELQTRELVETMLDKGICNIKYAKPELVALERFHQAYRDGGYYQKYVPAFIVKEFENETGLSPEFIGGEVSYTELRAQNEHCKNHIYTNIGNCFLSISKADYHSPTMLTMTRRSPVSYKPLVVFSAPIGTCHVTWLEKLIADNDPAYTKPAPVSKALKDYQVNGYFELEKLENYKGYDLYANSLYGQRIHFTTKFDHATFVESSLNVLKSEIDKCLKKRVDDTMEATEQTLKEAV